MAVLLAIAVTTVACEAGPSSRTFGGVFPADGAIPVMPVVLTDETGLVMDVTFDVGAQGLQGAPGVEGDSGISLVPADPNAVQIRWMGGACDLRTDVRLRSAILGGMILSGRTERDQAACRAVGIRRSMVLHFGGPVDLSRIGAESFE